MSSSNQDLNKNFDFTCTVNIKYFTDYFRTYLFPVLNDVAIDTTMSRLLI